jgi:predicted ester cyclase
VVEAYAEVVAGGDLDEALALIAPDVIDHRGGADGDHVGRDAWREKWQQAVETFGGVTVTVEHNVSAGDTSANRYRMGGIDPASGRSYEVTGLDMVRVSGGQIVEHWALLDQAALAAQLGLDG